MPGTRSVRGSTEMLWRSLRFSLRPNVAQPRTVGRRGWVNCRQAAPVLFNVLAPMPGGKSPRRQGLEGLPQYTRVILNQCVREAGFVTLLAAHQAPDQVLVAGVELVDPRLLLDHLG